VIPTLPPLLVFGGFARFALLYLWAVSVHYLFKCFLVFACVWVIFLPFSCAAAPFFFAFFFRFFG
jgi:hypothetical protein